MNMSPEERTFEEIRSGASTDAEAKGRFKPIRLAELLSMTFPENKWIVEKIVPHEGITILSGAPASYKTWLLLRMAIDIARGDKLLGQFQCEKSRVLIIDEENHLRLLQERLQLLGADKDLPIFFLSQKGFLVSDKNLVDEVLKACEEQGANVIFIDSLVRINNAEENDASQMSEVFRCIRQICQHRKTVIITHHERKEGAIKLSPQNRLRGSSDISAAVDAHIALKRDKNEKSKIIIEQAKQRSDKEIEPFEVEVRETGTGVEFCYLGARAEDAGKKELARDVVLALLENESEGLPRTEIYRRVNESEGIGTKSTREAIDDLVKEKALLERRGIKNEKICYLPKHQEQDIGLL